MERLRSLLSKIPMAEILDTDLFLVNRGDESYKVTFLEVKDSGGGGSGSVDPAPNEVFSEPAFDGGNGSESAPFLITSGTAFLGGEAESDQTPRS